MIDKGTRQQRIREILARNEIHTQDQLHGLLSAERIEITQATLSRDLRDIGAVRRPDGYTIDVNVEGLRLDTKGLERSLRGSVHSVARGGTIVVARTEAGHAPAVARRIDDAKLPLVIGTIAGHDSVFLAAGSAGEARSLERVLRRAAGLR